MNDELRAILQTARRAAEALQRGELGPNPVVIGVEPMAQWSWRVEALLRAAYPGNARADTFARWDDTGGPDTEVAQRFLASQLQKLDGLIATVDRALTRPLADYADWQREDFGPETPMAIQNVRGAEPFNVPRIRK